MTGTPAGRTMVACLGNIFLSDDGFGVEVARRLARCELPDGVRVTDYGIRGMHLAYDLAEGFDSTILVDATQRGGQPGTVYLIEPGLAADGAGPEPAAGGAGPGPAAGGAGPGPAAGGSGPAREDDGTAAVLARMTLLNAHGMQPDLVLSLAGTLGAAAGRVLVVGCEPASLEEGIGLSAPVTAAVDEAVRMVTSLVRDDPPPPRPAKPTGPESGKG